jgi:hypothetical protein
MPPPSAVQQLHTAVQQLHTAVHPLPLQDYGDPELMLAGVHENLPLLSYMDAGLRVTCAIADRLAESDMLLRRARRSSDFGLMVRAGGLLLEMSAATSDAAGAAGDECCNL